MSHLLRYLSLPAFAALLFAGCSEPQTDEGDALASVRQNLTAEQCDYFDVNGKVQICHHTSSATKPYTILRVSEQACVNAHSAHEGDYVTSTDPSSPLYDPTCNGQGCLPEGAPCDATLGCCDGLVCDAGTCKAPDACAAQPCQNGGDCTLDGNGGYLCACAAGFAGANCELDIDECAASPCVHGTCTDLVAHYECTCEPGWGGNECDVNLCGPGLPVLRDSVESGYVCACPAGLTGDACEVPWGFCASNPCLNGGTCNSEMGQCECPEGYGGSYCDQPAGGRYNCIWSNPCTEENILAGNTLFAWDGRNDMYAECVMDGGVPTCIAHTCPDGQSWSFIDKACVTVTACPCAQWNDWSDILAVQGASGVSFPPTDTDVGASAYVVDWDIAVLQSNMLLPETQFAVVIVPSTSSGSTDSGACLVAGRPQQSYFGVTNLSPAEVALCQADVDAAVARPDTTPLPDLPEVGGFLGAALLGLAEIGRRIVRRRPS